ncbi:MAG TPA: CARDB domain-containing protein, partial [Methanomethylovorans sp.]|nr:CARDB domain-containing protein [Methanomethylovorans sp.]
QDPEKLEWELQVDPHATNEITYIVSPHIPGNFTLGSAVASWRDNGDVYEVASAAPQLMVNGSYVVADKTVNTEYAMEGENVTVTLQISNGGDKEVKVSMHDNIPTDADLVSGSLEWSAKLAPGETSTKSYNIVFSEAGEYALPALQVDYTDVQMKEVTVYSEQVEMYIDREVVSEAY